MLALPAFTFQVYYALVIATDNDIVVGTNLSSNSRLDFLRFMFPQLCNGAANMLHSIASCKLYGKLAVRFGETDVDKHDKNNNARRCIHCVDIAPKFGQYRSASGHLISIGAHTDQSDCSALDQTLSQGATHDWFDHGQSFIESPPLRNIGFTRAQYSEMVARSGCKSAGFQDASMKVMQMLVKTLTGQTITLDVLQS